MEIWPLLNHLEVMQSAHDTTLNAQLGTADVPAMLGTDLPTKSTKKTLILVGIPQAYRKSGIVRKPPIGISSGNAIQARAAAAMCFGEWILPSPERITFAAPHDSGPAVRVSADKLECGFDLL